MEHLREDGREGQGVRRHLRPGRHAGPRRLREGLLGRPRLDPRHLEPGPRSASRTTSTRPSSTCTQSLHTTVIGLDGKRRSRCRSGPSEMHHRAEYGIAAHWGYKSKEDHSSEMAWLQRHPPTSTARPTTRSSSSRPSRSTSSRTRSTSSRPRARSSRSPARSTPVDFAYAIHTEVEPPLHRRPDQRPPAGAARDPALQRGHRRDHHLQGADGRPVSRDWLQIVASTRARNKIRQWFSRERREGAIENGREELARALRRDGLKPAPQALASGRPAAGGRRHGTWPTSMRSTPPSARTRSRPESIVQRLTKGTARRRREADEQLPTIARVPSDDAAPARAGAPGPASTSRGSTT